MIMIIKYWSTITTNRLYKSNHLAECWQSVKIWIEFFIKTDVHPSSGPFVPFYIYSPAWIYGSWPFTIFFYHPPEHLKKKHANICSNDNRNTEKYFQDSFKKRRECAIKLLDCSWDWSWEREILNWINAYWLISTDGKRKLWWLWDSPKFIDCLWKQVCHDGLLRVHRMDITLEFQLENEFLK